MVRILRKKLIIEKYEIEDENSTIFPSKNFNVYNCKIPKKFPMEISTPQVNFSLDTNGNSCCQMKKIKKKKYPLLHLDANSKLKLQTFIRTLCEDEKNLKICRPCSPSQEENEEDKEDFLNCLKKLRKRKKCKRKKRSQVSFHIVLPTTTKKNKKKKEENSYCSTYDTNTATTTPTTILNNQECKQPQPPDCVSLKLGNQTIVISVKPNETTSQSTPYCSTNHNTIYPINNTNQRCNCASLQNQYKYNYNNNNSNGCNATKKCNCFEKMKKKIEDELKEFIINRMNSTTSTSVQQQQQHKQCNCGCSYNNYNKYQTNSSTDDCRNNYEQTIQSCLKNSSSGANKKSSQSVTICLTPEYEEKNVKKKCKCKKYSSMCEFKKCPKKISSSSSSSLSSCKCNSKKGKKSGRSCKCKEYDKDDDKEDKEESCNCIKSKMRKDKCCQCEEKKNDNDEDNEEIKSNKNEETETIEENENKKEEKSQISETYRVKTTRKSDVTDKMCSCCNCDKKEKKLKKYDSDSDSDDDDVKMVNQSCSCKEDDNDEDDDDNDEDDYDIDEDEEIDKTFCIKTKIPKKNYDDLEEILEELENCCDKKKCYPLNRSKSIYLLEKRKCNPYLRKNQQTSCNITTLINSNCNEKCNCLKKSPPKKISSKLIEHRNERKKNLKRINNDNFINYLLL